MKRWQDLGEVEDSDDDDFAFSNESQSPADARKRPRLDDGGSDKPTESNDPDQEANTTIEGDALDDNANEPWLQPKHAITYTRKATLSEHLAAAPLEKDIDAQLRRVKAVCIAVPSQRDPATESGLQHGPSSSSSDQDDELPNLSQIITAQHTVRPHTPLENGLSTVSTLSSPLSELNGSPPPPDIFHFGDDETANSPARDSRLREDPSTTDDDAAIIAQWSSADQAATLKGRRTFRTRTEKQLHPYVWDKTLYQQQWKQRGLKPVHYNVADKQAQETQDQSYSGDESESQDQLVGSNRSPARQSSQLGDNSHDYGQIAAVSRAIDSKQDSQAAASDEDFPEIDAVLSRNVQGATYHGRKRRKVTHVQGDIVSKKAVTFRATDNAAAVPMDEYSIPPSPPPTSSDSGMQLERQSVPSGFRRLPSGFRLPFGTTPAPLPTPQVSSDVRPSRAAGDHIRSDSESPPRRLRTSTVARAQPEPTAIELGIDSDAGLADDTASESEVEDKRLRRVQKRIKGVLPASWLKIDLRARQRQISPSPSRPRRQSTASPPPSARPQKGVAQRVARTSATPARNAPALISDNESESDNGLSTHMDGQPSFQPASDAARLDLFRDDADDDHMEVDWVDPMLAGASRGTRGANKDKKRQPRITDAFGRSASGHGMDLIEERTGLQHRAGTSGTSRKATTTRLQRQNQAPRARSRRSSAPRLSILDGSVDLRSADAPIPQFVRLAQRQARRRADLGRHSPSRKVIRLATKEDTDEATTVLTVWREGTMVPHAMPDRIQNIHAIRAPGADDAMDDHEVAELTPGSDQFRHPLAEITNLQQWQLPSPLRKEAGAGISHRQQQAVQSRVRRRQTQLQPIVLRRDAAGLPSSAVRPRVDADARSSDMQTPLRRPHSRVQMQSQDVRYRGAQLESLENAYDQQHRAAAFERRMNCLTESIARPARGTINRPLQLHRLLEHRQDLEPVMSPLRREDGRALPPAGPAVQDQQARPFTLARRPRKRPPQHIDVEARHYRQPSEPLPDLTTIYDEPPTAPTDSTGPALHGLGPYGTRYATDFDVQPLAPGTYFHQSTFIGSGDFAASLNLADRDLTVVTGRMRVHVAGEVLDWGPWTEEVATGISRIPHAITDALQTLRERVNVSIPDEQLAVVAANLDHMLRSAVRYCSKCLTFLDPVDRRSCVQHLQYFADNLLDISFPDLPEARACRKLQTRCWQYALVVATQVACLSDHGLIQADAKQRSQDLATRAAQILTKHMLPLGFDELRSCCEDNRYSAKREAGIRDEDTAVSGVIIMYHCLRCMMVPQAQFWRVLGDAWQPDIGKCATVSSLDRIWYNLVTILPFLEVDDTGITRPGSRLRDAMHDWSIPRALTARLFELYPVTKSVRGVGVNDYFRATLTRSFWLVARWGWYRCEAMLGAVFDWFARRNLAPLDKEESRGSPRLLDELESSPSLEVQPEDRSFAIFLKMLALGLQNMQKCNVYSDKKIGGIAWRFIPNHGRTYPKDSEVKQADIDALRNHHDLLCTLYYASPPGHRLRVELVQALVDHASSHREACRLSVRAWANLASFQSSTSEPPETLEPLTAWFRENVHSTTMQFRLAKTEAECDFAAAKAQVQGAADITDALLTSTIAANQRSIAATLIDALAGLRRALLAASSLPTACALVEGCGFWRVFVPFDASEKRLVPALNEAVEVVKTALSTQRRLASTAESQGTSQESQDYGDSSALQEYAATEGADTTGIHQSSISEHLYEPVAQLVSNVFGADVSLEDAVLEKIVNAWVLVAKESIHGGNRSWSSFIDAYSPDSWHQLRDTEHKRKFTPYFLARIVEAHGAEDADVKSGIVTALLVSLVEREAMLKYQHLLITALLNLVSDDPLLKNLPFSRDRREDRYVVSLTDLRQRRLAVISSMLSNMRQPCEETMYARPQMLQQLRKGYGDMLRSFMQAMKSNYQALQGNGCEHSADPDLQGAYVAFVQHVVSFLQQYTTEICRVDPFFTDSASFPLPATDPMYVVGRLRSYVPKLAEAKTRKQLAVFVHSVSERAAVDGHQEYLVDQLRAAMDGVVERGCGKAPTLRHVLLTAIFPAYVEAALSTACSWILSLPILRVCSTVARDLLYYVRLENTASVDAVVETLVAVVCSLREPLHHALAHPGLLRLPHVHQVLALVFEAAGSLPTIFGHLRRSGYTNVQVLPGGMKDIYRGAKKVEARVRGTWEETWEEVQHASVALPEAWNDTRVFARKQLREALKNDWHAYDGSYFVRRGNTSKEVVARLDDEDEEQRKLLLATQRFCTSFEAIMVDGQARVQRCVVGGSCRMDGVMV